MKIKASTFSKTEIFFVSGRKVSCHGIHYMEQRGRDRSPEDRTTLLKSALGENSLSIGVSPKFKIVAVMNAKLHISPQSEENFLSTQTLVHNYLLLHIFSLFLAY